MAREALSRAAAAGAAMLASLMLASPAIAASETVIGFDQFPGGAAVPAGTIVTNQWEAEGVKFGKAEEFGQPTEAGNCGTPTVGTGKVPAKSTPNYAILATCVSAINTQGAFGAFVGPARGSLSVEVRDLNSSPNVQVTLTGYASGGKKVAEGHAEATNGEWQKIVATPNGEGPISYFAVSTGIVTSQEIAIDNLSFEAPASTTTTTTTPSPGPPPPPPPPTAVLALTTPNPHGGEPITLSGAGSSPGRGRIISYGWNFKGGDTEETSTGTDPEAHIMLSPGPHTITMIVTNSNHEHASTKFGMTLPKEVKALLPDGGEGECQSKLEIGDARLRAECIQKLGDGYVIQGEVALNGTVLAPKSGGFLKIKTVTAYTYGGGTETELYGAQVYVQLENTPLGSMVLGERNLETEPIPLELNVSAPPHFEGILHGLGEPSAQISAGGGSGGGSGGSGGGSKPTPTGGAKPSKTLLYVFGIGKNCGPGEHNKAGCCPPPNGHIVCAEVPGNFPLVGLVDVYLNNKGQTLLYVTVGLNLKEVNLEATGSFEIRVNDESGIELQSLKFEIGEAALKPIFKIKGASFEYFFPSYEEESKADTWQAKGTITFGEEVAQLKAEMAFKKGNFKKAAMSLKIKPGVPIYAGIFLNEIGATLAVEPVEFGGSLGASIAEVLELELEFRYREQNEHPPELGYFGGEGRLSFKENQIASLAADVYSDGYVDAALKVDIKLPFGSKNTVAEVAGGLSFWDETNNPHGALWQVQGEAFLKIWIIEIEGEVLVNNEYLAGCAAINGFGAEGHYHFTDGGIGGGFFAFSNCSDQLKEYKEKPATKHSGGFVKEESAHFAHGTAQGAALAGGAAAKAAASGESETFNLPEGGEGQELRIISSSGSPVVHFAGPGGQSYTTPSAPKQVASVPGQFIAALGPNPGELIVLLKHPKGGKWTIATMPGSGPLSKLETAEDVAPASVRVHVRHSRRGGYALAYNIAHHVPGSAVRFVERGKDSTHVLGTVKSAHGTLRFTPEEALSPSRSIVAYLLNGQGTEVRELPVGHYAAPGPFRPSPPRSVRFARHRNTAQLTWGAVTGARVYRVKVRGSDGRLETHVLKASVHSVSIPHVLGFESFTATVTAVGGKNMLPGRPATATLKPARVRRQRPRAHKKH